MDDLEARDRDIARLYIDEELSLLQLGKMCGLTKERVRQVLDRLGIERRGRGRPPGPVAEERRERHAKFGGISL